MSHGATLADNGCKGFEPQTTETLLAHLILVY